MTTATLTPPKNRTITGTTTPQTISVTQIPAPKTLYLAFGANLNLNGMLNRCPSARPISSVELVGWRLLFRGVADIEKTGNPEDILHGAIWEITDRCERSLDSFEGYPILYRKSYINSPSFERPIMFYTMNDRSISGPSSYYYATIREGYSEWGLDVSLLEKAAKDSGGVSQPIVKVWHHNTKPAIDYRSSIYNGSTTYNNGFRRDDDAFDEDYEKYTHDYAKGHPDFQSWLEERNGKQATNASKSSAKDYSDIYDDADDGSYYPKLHRTKPIDLYNYDEDDLAYIERMDCDEISLDRILESGLDTEIQDRLARRYFPDAFGEVTDEEWAEFFNQ